MRGVSQIFAKETVNGLVDTDFRKKMVNAVSSARIFDDWGVFLISCYYHTQSQNDDKWNGPSNIDGMVISHLLSHVHVHVQVDVDVHVHEHEHEQVEVEVDVEVDVDVDVDVDVHVDVDEHEHVHVWLIDL